MSSGDAIRVLALMESANVSGPAKNIIEFARRARNPEQGSPAVHLSLVTYIRGADSEFVLAAREAGIQTFTVQERRAFDTSAISQLKDIVAKCDPDILQSHNIKSHFYVRLNGLYKRYPWVVFNHGYTSIDLKDRMYGQVDRWSLRRAYRVVAVCGPFADRLTARGVKRDCIRIQHNSVKPFSEPDTAQVMSAREELRISDEQVIACVGRLSSEKGQYDLLSAVALICKMPDIPRFRVVLVGEGPDREQLVSEAAALGIAEVVSFAGHRRDVRPWYRVATILALPSHSEGSPNVVLEAMSAGLPVAATAVGGVPEILTDGVTGLIVPSRDPSKMAAALARLLRDPVLRTTLGQAGLEHVSKSFTPENYRASLASFYEQVLRDWRQDSRITR